MRYRNVQYLPGKTIVLSKHICLNRAIKRLTGFRKSLIVDEKLPVLGIEYFHSEDREWKLVNEILKKN